MFLEAFSEKYPDEFLTRNEDNFDVFLEKFGIFYQKTRADIQDGQLSRRNLNGRFAYGKELEKAQINQKGVSTEKIAEEFNDMLRGCMRQHDPLTAFNMIPPTLLDAVIGVTLTSLYNPNPFWDFVSGKLCLYEKKIMRMLGKLVEWDAADGFTVTGGKQALLYAIKCGMARANSCATKMDEFVVICSASAHYSIEHVCYYLGMSPENCIRVATRESGEIDIAAFEDTLKRVLNQNKRIAAVIGIGGATIDLIPDPIALLKETIDSVAASYDLDYVPYLHVDSVITWTWLAFENSPKHFRNKHIAPNISDKIERVVSKISGIKYADSFAADFHKTGFCPYSAGVFVTKDSVNLAGLTQDDYVSRDDLHLGEWEPFRLTCENSRPAHAIVSIWIALRKMGLAGLREYVLYQLQVCETFKNLIQEKYSEHFEILNHRTCGWEIVFKPLFGQKQSWDELLMAPENQQQEYIKDCYAFLNDLWYGPFNNKNQRFPVIGFVRKYSRKGSFENNFPAFLIHPISLHYDDRAVDEMLSSILEVKTAFEAKQFDLAEPATYLHGMTPPR